MDPNFSQNKFQQENGATTAPANTNQMNVID
jgi:hypothetical protein